MGAPKSLLENARAFARDFPRDRMPAGYLWDVADYVPTIIDTTLTGRGGWRWGSSPMSGDAEAGIYAPYSNGDKLLVQTTNGRLYEVDTDLSAAPAVTDRGPLPRSKQNPVQLLDTVIHFDGFSSMTPRLITNPGSVPTIAGANAAHKFSPLGTIYKAMMVTGGAPGELDTLRFSVPGKNLANADSFDANSFLSSSRAVTALAALRAVILVFHAGSVERVRGAIPPNSNGTGDMSTEPLFDRAGCLDPKSIAYWNDNCVFADEHGVHVTDGSVIRNLVSQGGILYFWRLLYEHKLTLAATTFLDYYVITVRRSDAVPPVTLICDLNKRQWFRFTNLDSLVYVASSGGSGMERVWAGLAGKARLARVGPCFYPDFSIGSIQDDDGTPVLPAFETPWYRLSDEGRKRIRFGYLSYDVRVPPEVAAMWRSEEFLESIPPPAPPEVLAAVAPVLDVGFITSPQDLNYQSMGGLPPTDRYTRYRLPLNKFPYGVAFRVKQTRVGSVTRIFDLAVEAMPAERSRV